MLRNLVTAWAIPEVRARITYVLGMIAVFVVGLHIPVPGVNLTALENLVRTSGLLNLFDVFSGSAFRRFTIFALGITPYINASIVMQLMTVALPQLKEMQREGETGRRQIAKYTRYLTVVLAMVQAIGLLSLLSAQSAEGAPIFSGGWLTKIQVVISLTAGTTFLMWMGESITEKGIGQGVSLMIFMSILTRLPYDVRNTALSLNAMGPMGIFSLAMLLAIFTATVMGIVYVTGGTRRIPIQHARRQIGNRITQASSSFLPFKVNSAGVMPIIFAISLLLFPQQFAAYFVNMQDPNSMQSRIARIIVDWTTPGHNHLASLVYGLLIMGFTYFWAAIQIDIQELSDNLKKNGSFIPGIRPGKPTRDYLDRVLTRITFAGALFLAIIGLVQYYIPNLTRIQTFSLVGGTSLLIAVGVALDFMNNLEAHLMMRNYEGFIRQSGRRAARSTFGGGSLRL